MLLLEQSPYLQGFMKKALEHGLEQGLENGKRTALLGVLDRLLTSRFEGVPVSTELKRLETKKLQSLVDHRQILRDP